MKFNRLEGVEVGEEALGGDGGGRGLQIGADRVREPLLGVEEEGEARLVETVLQVDLEIDRFYI